MYPFRPDPIIRIRISEPGGEERRSRPCEPRPASTVAAARQLVEGTRLTLATIGHRVGVSQSAITRWSQKHGWQRPPGAWPTHGSRREMPLRIRSLRVRLRMQAERLLRDLEAAPEVDPHKLAEALALVKQARVEHCASTHRRKSVSDPAGAAEPDAPRPRSAVVRKAWRTRLLREEARRRGVAG